MNRNRILAFTLALALLALTLTACTRSLSEAPADQAQATPTVVGAIPTAMTTDPMAALVAYSTQTAMAEENAANPQATTPAPASGGEAVTEAPTEAPAEAATTEAPTEAPPTPTPTPEPVIVFTSAPAVVPASYALQPGEFPYCIARRFDINPDQLLAANGLSPTDGRIYYPGLTLTIPQDAGPFPGERALRSHPDFYTVGSSEETIYGVACKYGDVDPMDIAAVNNLTAPYALQAGQILEIP